MKNIWYNFKGWMSYFIDINFLLTPVVIEKWYNCEEDNTLAIYIFGFRIFLWKRW